MHIHLDVAVPTNDGNSNDTSSDTTRWCNAFAEGPDGDAATQALRARG